MNLRRWVAARRQELRAQLLSGEQMVALEQLPGWSWGATQDETWDRNLAALRAVVAGRGTANIQNTLLIDGVNVGRWVSRQRATYRAGTLTPLRAQALQRLPGWTWCGWS